MPIAFNFIAILSATCFAGAAVYINLVEHPARLSCGTEIAATVAGAIRWLQTANVVWLCGAAAILAVVPVTLVVIFPTNKKLLEPGRDLTSSETQCLLERWGRLHAIRSALSIAASVLFIWAATH